MILGSFLFGTSGGAEFIRCFRVIVGGEGEVAGSQIGGCWKNPSGKQSRLREEG